MCPMSNFRILRPIRFWQFNNQLWGEPQVDRSCCSTITLPLTCLSCQVLSSPQVFFLASYVYALGFVERAKTHLFDAQIVKTIEETFSSGKIIYDLWLAYVSVYLVNLFLISLDCSFTVVKSFEQSLRERQFKKLSFDWFFGCLTTKMNFRVETVLFGGKMSLERYFNSS